MRTHRESALRISSLLALAAGLTACDQPSPKCNIARGTFSARYVLVQGSVTGTGDCGSLVGEELAVQSYNQRKGSSDPYPDPDNVVIGIQPTTLTGLLERGGCSGLENAASEVPYATGGFQKSDPSNNDVCVVPSLTPAHVVLPAADACMPDECTTLPPEPAVDVLYEWSNVRVYVTAGANGTQFSADLRYTKDGCSAQYKVTAIYPSVSCAMVPSTEANPATDPDAGEDASVADAGLGGMDSAVGMDAQIDSDADLPIDEDAGAGECEEPGPPGPDPVADDGLCAQTAPLSADGPTGSNINPGFMVQCDPQLLRCVLTGDPPSLR